MNLTKCFAVGLCLSAMTASAAFLVDTNDFEGSLYGWTGDINALDDVVDGATGVTDANTPIVGNTDSKVLKLDTEGGVWTNEVGASFFDNAIYVDMLVKFVPSEELPTLDPAVKLAIAVTNGSLVVSKINALADGNEWASTTTAIDTSLWYRVTVKLETGDNVFNASVTINGSQLVSVGGETLFGIFDNSYEGTLNSIGFQGTGFVDEITVRDDDPFASSTVAFGNTGPQVDPVELAAWKSANNITGTEDVDSFNAFVMNVAPEDDGTSPVLVVNSIIVGGNVVLTVKAKYADNNSVDLGSPLNNGAVITVWGKPTLETGTWSNVGTSLSFTDPVNHFFMVTTGENPNPQQ